jgi:DNA polymerase-3 subunit delta'
MLVGYLRQFEFLKKSFNKNSLAHALIFVGEENLGKKTLALEFIKFINCQKKDKKEACEFCPSCETFKKGWYPDLLLIEDEGVISINQIKEVSQFLSEKSFYQGGIKSVIIDHAEKMTNEAESALLKILEEPKGNTLIILITSFYHQILKTITSRCQKIYFSPLPSKVLEDFLKDKKIPEEEKKELIFYSYGRMGRLINFLKNPDLLKKEKKILEEFLSLFNKDLYKRFEYVKNLNEKEIELDSLIKTVIDYLRNLLIKKESYNLKEWQILEALNEFQFEILFTNINKRLALENIFLNF